MYRNDLLDQLVRYQAKWPEEHEMTQAMIGFVKRHADCFERSLAVGHVTGSAWVVNRDGTHVLLTHHRKLNRWLQLGGHADGDPDVLRVALREVREESGIDASPWSREIFDVDIHLIPGRGNEPGHYHYDVRYLLRAEGDETPLVSDESHAVRWIPVSSLGEFTNDGSMLRMAAKWNAIKAVVA